MPSKVMKKEVATSDPVVDGNSVQTSKTARVGQPGVDAISTEGSKSSRGKRKRNAKDEVENSIDKESPEKPKRNKKVKVEVATEVISPSGASSKQIERGDEIEVKEESVLAKIEDLQQTIQTPTKAKKKKKTKAKVEKESVDIDGEEVKDHTEEEVETPKKAKRKRKTKEEKEAEAMPIAARTTGLKMYVGAHVSGAKGRSQRSTTGATMYIASIEAEVMCIPGIHNSITNCAHIG